MYVYSLKPYLRDRIRSKGWLGWEYTKEIFPGSTYAEHTALSYYSDVMFYSEKPLRHVPARNGILLPVKFFDEEMRP